MVRYSLFYIVYSVIVSFFMSFIMSGTVTLVSIGFSEQFFVTWLSRSFPTSYIIALPTSLFLIPALATPANKIADYISKQSRYIKWMYKKLKHKKGQ